MAEVVKKYDLVGLYERAFGVKAVRPNINAQIIGEHIASRALKTLRTDFVSTKDYEGFEPAMMGHLLFMPCELDAPPTLGKFKLPNEPIVELKGGKRIVKTEIDGMDGTFKELFSLDDYQITIRGLIVQEDGTNNYPQGDVMRLRDYCEVEHEVGINCASTNYFNVTQMVIESWDFPAMEGFPGVQPYILNCLSDKDFKLILE